MNPEYGVPSLQAISWVVVCFPVAPCHNMRDEHERLFCRTERALFGALLLVLLPCWSTLCPPIVLAVVEHTVADIVPTRDNFEQLRPSAHVNRSVWLRQGVLTVRFLYIRSWLRVVRNMTMQVIGIQSAVMLGFTMGANDVANAFGTSVGAGILTINQACIIASIFDVTGSLTLGAGVSSTIASKIIDVSIYESQPGLYMVGMLSASLGAMTCVGIATKLGMPISTTHAVVGAVMGFSFVETTKGLVWFNGKAGLGSIFLSWVVSPIFAGLVSAGVYMFSRYVCFQYANENASDVMLRFAFERQHKLSAFIMGWVAFLIVIFVAYSMTTSGTVFDYLNVMFALMALVGVTMISYKVRIIDTALHGCGPLL